MYCRLLELCCCAHVFNQGSIRVCNDRLHIIERKLTIIFENQAFFISGVPGLPEGLDRAPECLSLRLLV